MNLNIRRMIFFSMEKYSGYKLENISTSLVKQISGKILQLIKR
jgi:hypothetical protein